jgi:ACS family hexuronate transporter-like MFS transporter
LPIYFAGRLTSVWLAVGFLGIAAAAHQGWSANLYTTASDMFPKNALGAVVGIGSMAGATGGVVFALATGWVLQLTHSYGLLFAVSATAYLIGWFLLRILAPGLQRVDVATI